MITIAVNGSERHVAEGASLGELVRALSLDPTRIAVELNDAVVPRPRYDETPLSDGDRLEIVQFVGGG